MQQSEVIKNQWVELSNYMDANKHLHYSFDFWNTIAFSNPTFKKERTNFIHEILEGKFTKEIIDEAFSVIGKNYNSSIENNEETLTVNELYLRVFEYIGVNQYLDLEKIKEAIFDLFLKYPPSICENFISYLNKLELNSVTISITSNTTFIPGFIIEKFLHQIDLLKKFSFCVFSDKEQVAKPNKKIFDIVLSHLNNKIKSAIDVIHIGDNLQADYVGAKKSGLSAFLIDCKTSLINTRNALHVISDIESVPFSALDYSKFKFGDYQIAGRYGHELFNYFKEIKLPNLLQNYDSILIYSSPYNEIPTSSYYLTQSFYSALSNYLNESQNNMVTIKFCKIKRCQTYTEDYGALNAEERFNLIKNDTYEFVDIPSSKDICIFIDDISITGTHQRVVEKLMQDCDIKTNSIFLYYAKLCNPDVCPSIENYLNYAFTSDVVKLLDVILSDFYKITTRITKYILSLKTKDLEYLIDEIKQRGKYSILHELVKMSEANQYNNIEIYKQNLKTLKQCVLELNTESMNF
jgi:FMN phosphatase YigB (HAD superfamily)